MATELHLTIRGDTTAEVMSELTSIGARAVEVLGVVTQEPQPEPTPAPPSEPAAVPAAGNGADTPAPKSRSKKAAAAPAPEPEKTKLDRSAIIEGLTKIYSKGDDEVRLAITKFRDGQGADRLRDLKDDALPAAADLLADLRSVAADAP
jgi:hypothetical protein